MRVLAVQMSDDLFDKLGEYVKETGVTKQNYINDLVRKDIMNHKQVQEINPQKVWDRENVEKAIDDFIKINDRIPSQKEFKNENGLPSYGAAGRCLEESPAQYCQRKFNEIHGIEETELQEPEYENAKMLMEM